MPDELPSENQMSVPLEYQWPESAVTRFANQFMIQVVEGTCYLNFFESVPPLLVGTPEDIGAQAARITSIPAVGVARIVVPLTKLPEILNAISMTAARVFQASISDQAEKGAGQ